MKRSVINFRLRPSGLGLFGLGALPFECDYLGESLRELRESINKLKILNLLIFGPNPNLYKPDFGDVGASVLPNSERLRRDGEGIKVRSRAPEGRILDLGNYHISGVDLEPFHEVSHLYPKFKGWYRPGHEPIPPRREREEMETELRNIDLERNERGTQPPVWLMKPVVEPNTQISTRELEVVEAFIRDPFRPILDEPNIYRSKNAPDGRTLVFVAPSVEPTARNFIDTRFRRLFSLVNSVAADELPDAAGLLRDIPPVRGVDLRSWIEWRGDPVPPPHEPDTSYGYLQGSRYVTSISPDGRVLGIAFQDQFGNRIVILPRHPSPQTTAAMLGSVVANVAAEKTEPRRRFHSKLVNHHAKSNMLLSRSAAWTLCLDRIRVVCATPDPHVLLVGSTGSGKEFLAELIHKLTPSRAKETFRPLNCATLSPTLATSQLFGHIEGIGTNMKKHKGIFIRANGSSVLLDEFQELMHIDGAPGKLLRVMQDGDCQRVGEEGEGTSVNVRIIGATNDLRVLDDDHSAVRSGLLGRFTHIIRVPDLLQRWSDVRPLVEFLVELEARSGEAARKLGPKYILDVDVCEQLAALIMNRMDVAKVAAMNARWLQRVVREAISEIRADRMEHERTGSGPGRLPTWDSPTALRDALAAIAKDPANAAALIERGTYCGFSDSRGLRTYISEINPTTKSTRKKASRDVLDEIKSLLKDEEVAAAIDRTRDSA